MGASFTGNDGNFAFAGVPNGAYEVQVQLDGYEPYDQAIEVNRGPIFGIQVELNKVPVATSAPSGPTVSAHQLGVPPKAQKEFDKGFGLMSSKADYRGAIAAFDRAIQDYPDYYEAYALEGTAFEGLTDLPSAEKAFRKAVELSSSKYTVALYFLAGLLSGTNRYAEAGDLSRQCVALDESSWHCHFELAHALLGLQQFNEAEVSADRARDLKPDNPRVFLLLANIHSGLRNYTAFIQDLDSYLALAPTGPMADQARKQRDQVQQALREQQIPAQPPPPPAQQP